MALEINHLGNWNPLFHDFFIMRVSLKYNKIPEDILNNLNANSKNIGIDTKKIWSEYQLINRMIYRSQNQHKASFPFQHLKEVEIGFFQIFNQNFFRSNDWVKELGN